MRLDKTSSGSEYWQRQKYEKKYWATLTLGEETPRKMEKCVRGPDSISSWRQMRSPRGKDRWSVWNPAQKWEVQEHFRKKCLRRFLLFQDKCYDVGAWETPPQSTVLQLERCHPRVWQLACWYFDDRSREGLRSSLQTRSLWPSPAFLCLPQLSPLKQFMATKISCPRCRS